MLDPSEIPFGGSQPSWDDVEAMAEAGERERLEAIRRGTGDLDDRDAAEELVDQVEDLLRRVGEGTAIESVNDEYKRKARALGAVLRRLGVEHANPYGTSGATTRPGVSVGSAATQAGERMRRSSTSPCAAPSRISSSRHS